MCDKPQIYAVVADKNEYMTSLANTLDLPIVKDMTKTHGFFLFLQGNILSLKDAKSMLNSSIYVDFSSPASTYRRQQGGGKNQPLAKAVGLNKKPGLHVLDATAGLAKDAFVLAALGAELTLVERSPIVGALLRDALSRAEEDAEIQSVASRMHLIVSDSIEYMRLESVAQHAPDVVYLDPMYPERKKSAKVKKEMQTLQNLLGHQDDLEQLLEAALGCAKNRVVVKRPKGAPALSAKPVTHTVESKKTRYDVYMRF